MFCGNCGTKLKEGAAFCQNCGTPVPVESPAPVEETKQPVESPAPAEETKQPVESPAPVEEAKQPVESPAPAEETKQPVESPAPVEETKQPVESPAPAVSPVPAEEAKQPVVSPIPAESEKQPRKKGSKGPIIVLVVLLLLVIGAGAGVGIYFTSDGYNIKKNLKLARQCSEEEEYEDALDYYDRALDLDDTLVDAYLESADIYVLQDEYESALELLTRARKRTREDETADPLLVNKLTEIYQAAAAHYEEMGDYNSAYVMLKEGITMTEAPALTTALEELYRSEAEKYLAQDNLYMARDVLKTGAEATGSSALSKMLVETYSQEAEKYLELKSYYDALWALDDGIAATGDESLAAGKIKIYTAWAEDSLSQGYYSDALWVLDEGITATGDVSLAERKVNVYTQWAEDCKDAGEYTDALDVLDKGLEATGDASLTEQKNYLISHLALAKTTAYSGYSIQMEQEYDEEGNLIKSFYYSYGSMDSGYEAEYNAAGETLLWTEYEDGQISYVITFDESGHPIDQTWYDQYGDVESYATAEVQADDGGSLQQIVWTEEGTGDTMKIQYLYDDGGNLAAVYRYDGNDSLIQGNEYQDGQIAKTTLYNGDEILRETEYTYIISDSKQVYIASEVIRDGDGSVDSWNKYEYEFDAMGNATVETGYYGNSYNYDETLSNGYYDYQWTYTNEYRYVED